MIKTLHCSVHGSLCFQRIEWLEYFKHVFSPVGRTVDKDFSVLVFDYDYFHRLGLLWEAFDKR